MPTCTRRFQFCAGHRVHRHESKCRNLHGHNYVALVTCYAQELDRLGRVIDFSVIKDVVGGWIDQHWDHGFILDADDHEAALAINEIPEQKRFFMSTNPTAENMARLLLETADGLLSPAGVRVTKVQLYETENCYAEVERTYITVTAELPEGMP